MGDHTKHWVLGTRTGRCVLGVLVLLLGFALLLCLSCAVPLTNVQVVLSPGDPLDGVGASPPPPPLPHDGTNSARDWPSIGVHKRGREAPQNIGGGTGAVT